MNQNQDLQSLNNPIDKVIVLFRSIQKFFKEQMFEKSKQYGFTWPQMALIFTLHKKPYTTLHELSDQMGLSKSTVSGIVDRLVAQGVIRREIPEDNRRIVKLSLSPDFIGKNDLMDLKNKYFTDTLTNASPEDLEKIICGLEKLHSLMTKDKNSSKESNG